MCPDMLRDRGCTNVATCITSLTLSMGKGKETIAYATASSMKSTWTPQGELTGMAENSFTIHPGIIEFNKKWYLFYHNATLTINGRAGAIGRRSVCG